MAEDVFGIIGSTQAGSFLVERPVAEGGFGVVYRAQHGAFRAPVALKCLKVPSNMTAEQRAAFLEKFREEAELLFRLSASIAEVVRPLQFGLLELPTQFVPFLALEWLEGRSLLAVLEERRAAGHAPMGLHKLVKLLTPIARALGRAHHFPGPEGPIAIIHRDLKPDNVFLAESAGASTMKILDFGIAKVKSVTSAIAGHSTAGDLLNAFTPSYGAPEQWLPKRYGQAGPWTDVWGMAIMMVEALAGRCPIEGELGAMMATTLDEKRRPTPRTEGVVVAPDVEAAFARALAVDPRERTKDIETFWTELETALGLPRTFSVHDHRRDSGQIPQVRPGMSDPPPPCGAGVPADAAARPEPASLASADTLATPAQVGGGARALRADKATAPLALVARPVQGDLPAAPGGRGSFEVPDLMPSAPAARAAAAPAVVPQPEPAPSHRQPAAPPQVASKPAQLTARPAQVASKPAQVATRPAHVASRRPAGSDDDIDVGGRSFELAAPPPSAPIAPRRPMPQDFPDGPAPSADLGVLRERIRGPAWLVFGAVTISVADLMYTRATGVILAFEGLRPIWIAAPLVLLGVGLGIWRLLGD